MKTLLQMKNRSGFRNLPALFLGILSLWSLTPGLSAVVGQALPPPSISSFSPSSGPVGTIVILHGENLSGTLFVKFNGVPATFTFFGSQITTSVPEGATTGPITVSTLDGTATSFNDFVVFLTAPPVITSFSPASGPAGTSVTINGQSLAGATEVKFNGITATFTTDLSGANLIATVPPSAGTGPITVRTPTGFASSANTFTSTETPPPLITGFTPSNGPVGTRVTITGTNFTGTTAVKFNGQNAEFTVGFFGATIAVFVPAGATTGLISLESPEGPAVSATVFTVTAAPSATLTGFSPNYGQAGQLVTISGTHLEGATSVLFNGITAPFNVFGSSTIFATLPAGVSTGPITVFTPGGFVTSSNSFFVGLAITMTASADNIPAGENFIYTITVLNDGRSDAGNVTLTDLLPNGVNLGSAFSTVGVCSVAGQSITCSFGALAPGASAIVKIIVSAPAPGTFTNSASVSTTDDPNSANHSTSITTTVVGDIAPPVTLAINSRPDGSVEISWPADAAGFFLETTESLIPVVAWSLVTTTPQIVAGRKIVISDTISSSQFFRLRSP
jgi:large repetitive protein